MRFLIVILLICAGTLTASAQDISPSFNEQIRGEVLQKIGDLLAKNYVSPSVGAECQTYLLEQKAKSELINFAHPRLFVQNLNSALFKVHGDKHVRISYITSAEQKLAEERADLNLLLESLDEQSDNFGFRQIQIMPDNVGYLNLTSFEPYEMAGTRLGAAVEWLANCDALIIDLRENRGGDLGMVCALAGKFFSGEQLFSSYYWRRGDYVEEYWTRPDSLPGILAQIPLFILIGSKTFSAAEDFAYGMQVLHRATLIGEITGGGANPGFNFRIDGNFSIFIPTGRAINPVTGENWEKKGVEPDIPVSENNALAVAGEKAGFAARTFRQQRNRRAVDIYWRMLEEMQYAASKPTKITNSIDSLVRNRMLDEWTINRLAYHFLNHKDTTKADLLFRYNVHAFPASLNAYDSLGEFYFRTGNPAEAERFYRKVLELDQHNQNAQYMLEKIRSRE